jgi:hypothetical protein
MPGDSKPISDAALSRLTAYVEIECEGSDDEFIEGNDVRVNFADLKGLLARLRSVEMERDQNFARLELAEDECRRTHDRVEWWKRRWDEAQAKLSEVERERKRFWEVADILVNTVCECDSRIRGYECCYNDSDARRLAIELLSPSGGKDSSGSIQVVTSESVPDDTVLFVKDGKEVGRIENLDSSGEDRGEGGE